MDEIVASFAAIQEIVERGQADGSIRTDLDARLASYVFYGAIDELLTGWVLGRLPDSDEDLDRAEQTVVEIVAGGLAPEHATRRPSGDDTGVAGSSAGRRSSGAFSGRSARAHSASPSRSRRSRSACLRCCTRSPTRAR